MDPVSIDAVFSIMFASGLTFSFVVPLFIGHLNLTKRVRILAVTENGLET
jgi:hypothetical protein